jgi:hypothetical protein
VGHVVEAQVELGGALVVVAAAKLEIRREPRG